MSTASTPINAAFATVTATPFPSQTHKATLTTPSPTYTPSKTLTPSVTLPPAEATKMAIRLVTAQAWKEYLTTAIPATLEARDANCDSGMIFEIGGIFVLESSSAEWTVFTCSPKSGFAGRYTQVTKVDRSRSWRIYYENFYWSQRVQALLSTYRWSDDGKHLFLVPFTYFFPSGGDFTPIPWFLNGHAALYRLNLLTGKFDTILDQIRNENMFIEDYAFSLSPNERYLAYAMYAERKLVHIIDLETGDERLIELDVSQG